MRMILLKTVMKMLSREECLKEYGSDYQIRKRISAGELYLVGKAVYSKQPDIPDLAVLAYKYPHAVITMHTAFYMHGLTDVIPDEYDLATGRDDAKIREKNVNQYFIPKVFFKVGVESMDYRGYEIFIYSKERMLIELLRYKSKLPFDYYKEILLNYRRIMPKLNIQQIQDYALESPKSARVIELLRTEVL